MSPIKGNKRLNPWKDDLQRYRETFAEQLQTQGLDCNATPRAAQGQGTSGGAIHPEHAADSHATRFNGEGVAETSGRAGGAP